jgi:hypothetical protein
MPVAIPPSWPGTMTIPLPVLRSPRKIPPVAREPLKNVFPALAMPSGCQPSGSGIVSGN